MKMARRVLIVDDDESIRDVLDLVLSQQGYEVTTAPHGAAALSILDQISPAVILLDMKMPVMDGWEFARAYRGRPGPRVPIVVLTAATDAAERAGEIGAEDYVSKPCNLDDLFRTIKRFAG